MAQIRCRCGCGVVWPITPLIGPLAWEPPYSAGASPQKKREKKRKENKSVTFIYLLCILSCASFNINLRLTCVSGPVIPRELQTYNFNEEIEVRRDGVT